MSNTKLGLAVGLALGFVAAFGGPIAFVVVLGCGAAGLCVGRVLDGANDLPAVTDSLSRGARRAGAALRACVSRLRLRPQSQAGSGRLRRGTLEETAVLDRRRPTGRLRAWVGLAPRSE